MKTLQITDIVYMLIYVHIYYINAFMIGFLIPFNAMSIVNSICCEISVCFMYFLVVIILFSFLAFTGIAVNHVFELDRR